MTFIESVRRGFRGWGKIVTGNEMASAQFDNSRFGLLTALALYTMVVLVALAAQIFRFGVMTPMALSIGIIAQYLPLVALAIVTPLTYAVLRLPGSPRELLIPAIYLMSFFLAIQTVIPVVEPAAMLGIIAFFLFRAARIVTGLSIISALIYAVLNVVLLVALPMLIYMQGWGGGPI